MLLVFAPLMALIALMIWRQDGAPIIFKHKRIGRGGRVFECMKFRTMVNDADLVLERLLESDPVVRLQWEKYFKLDNDPRVIPGIGTLLRKSSLDELPQLLNVLAGDMSLVGPRPVTEVELHKYGAYRDQFLSVKPGLTGLWQIDGRSATTYEQRVQLDVMYINNATVMTDLGILFRTTTKFVSGRLTGAR